jgi:hypothetical protein
VVSTGGIVAPRLPAGSDVSANDFSELSPDLLQALHEYEASEQRKRDRDQANAVAVEVVEGAGAAPSAGAGAGEFSSSNAGAGAGSGSGAGTVLVSEQEFGIRQRLPSSRGTSAAWPAVQVRACVRVRVCACVRACVRMCVLECFCVRACLRACLPACVLASCCSLAVIVVIVLALACWVLCASFFTFLLIWLAMQTENNNIDCLMRRRLVTSPMISPLQDSNQAVCLLV